MSNQTSIADDFLYALRSGDYKQGRGKYYDKDTDCYCAMGVWFDITGTDFNTVGKVSEGMTLFEDAFPSVTPGKLMSMNDSKDNSLTFEQIADYLEPFKKA